MHQYTCSSLGHFIFFAVRNNYVRIEYALAISRLVVVEISPILGVYKWNRQEVEIS